MADELGDILHRSDNGVRVAVKLTPGGNREYIGGIIEEADGAQYLKAVVTMPPEKGKANKAMIALLARAWNVPKGSLSIVKGEHDKRKVVEISGNVEWLFARVDGWFRQKFKADDSGN